MGSSVRLYRLSVVAFALGVGLAMGSVSADTIIEEWGSVKAPPPPEVKPVTVETKSTALLMLDFTKQNCGPRPRCIASLPKMQKLLNNARAKNVIVVYSLHGQAQTADILKEVAPAGSEPLVRSGANKFNGTDLDKILKGKDIKTVIVTGTAANGAVLYTASNAGLMGFKVIVPVDGMSAQDPFAEMFSAWQLANGPGFGPQVTITRSDMIKF
jgi:nicotinamidase-related amidase